MTAGSPELGVKWEGGRVAVSVAATSFLELNRHVLFV